MKKCTTCSIEKSLSEYSKKGSGLQPVCKICAKEYIRNYYAKNKNRWYKYAEKKKQWDIDNPIDAKIKAKEKYAKSADRQKAYQKQRNLENPTRIKENNLKKYGLTLPQFEELKLKQGGKCAICKTNLEHDSKSHVDHCHRTNVVRGLLCHLCNPGLGMFKDSIEILKSAQEYLEKYSEKFD